MPLIPKQKGRGKRISVASRSNSEVYIVRHFLKNIIIIASFSKMEDVECKHPYTAQVSTGVLAFWSGRWNISVCGQDSNHFSVPHKISRR